MKRAPEKQLSKDDPPSSDEADGDFGMRQGIQKASADVMAKRRIVKARRGAAPAAATCPAKPNPFAGLAKAPAVEAFLPANVPADTTADVSADVPAAENAKEGEKVKKVEEAAKVETKEVDVKENGAKTVEGEGKMAAAKEEVGAEGGTDEKAESPAAPEKANGASPSKEVSAAPAAEKDVVTGPSGKDALPTSLQTTSSKPVFSFGSAAGAATFGSAAVPASTSGFKFSAPPAEATEKAEEKAKFVETAVLTGEEDEKEVFRAKGRLFTLEAGKWTERGGGAFKVNVDEGRGRARIVMRTEATLRVILNTPVVEGFTLDRANDKVVRFQGLVVDDGSEEKKTHATYLAKFFSKEEVDKLIGVVEGLGEKEK